MRTVDDLRVEEWISMAMLQLDPPIPLVLESGEPVVALVILDYGPEYDTLFLVACQTSRQLWWLPNSQLRLGDNVSLGRPPGSAVGSLLGSVSSWPVRPNGSTPRPNGVTG